MEVDEEPKIKTCRLESGLVSESCDQEELQREKKDKKRRRSSFCAKRHSITPFIEVPADCRSDLSTESGAESITGIQVSGLRQHDKCAQYEKEIQRLTEESAAWENRLKDSQNAASAAQQRVSDQQLLGANDLPGEVNRNVQNLIGQVPDYASILERMHKQAKKVQLMVEDIGLFTEACERFAKKNELILNDFAESLNEQSIYDMESPRTLLQKRLAVDTQK